MSKETERIFKEMHKALEEQEIKNDEQMRTFVDKFIQDYNNKLNKEHPMDSYDYLEMAQSAISDKEAIKYAQKALKLDPYCLEAELVIAQAKAMDSESFKKNMEKVIKKGEEQLQERGIDKKEDAGGFYGILETRPYMRVRKAYVELLIAQGRFRHAMQEAEELLELCETDNLGVRYLLMALYCYFEDESKATKLIQKYEENSAFMILPLIALYYKLENEKRMKKYMIKLQNSNVELKEALELLMNSEINSNIIDEILSEEMYKPFSLQEVVLAFSEASFLYMPMEELLLRLYKECNCIC